MTDVPDSAAAPAAAATLATALDTPPGRVARTVDSVVTRMLALPAARTAYTTREERIPMRDGVVLLGTHYLPDTAHPLGTVLVRTPYGRSSLLDVTTSRTMAARGYHVLVQSCRGTFGSGGVFDPMGADVDDAQDTVGWLRTQTWFDGRLATAGGSYLGWVQWALLVDPPPELRACVVVVGPHDFADVTYGTGAFTLNDFLGWSHMIAHLEDAGPVRSLLRAAGAPRRLAPVHAGLPLPTAAEQVLDGRAPWYRDWVSHTDREDAFWSPRKAGAALEHAEAPVLLVGGWQDLFLRQTMAQYEALHARGVDVALTVGPWTHIDTAGKGSGTIARETLGWLDEHLAGATGRTRSAPVRIHVTGGGGWRDLPEWPPPSVEHVRRLGPGGTLPSATADDSRHGGPHLGEGRALATFRYDPADPTPTVGGRLLTGAAGVRDNRALEARADVVAFTSEPVATDLEIVGTPYVELEHGTDNPYADVFVRLCDVDAKGRSHNFTDALVRLDPAHPAPTLRIPLDPCAHRLAAGHRLRLLVAGGSHPRFARNTGTGEPPAAATTLVPATHTVRGGRVVLPVTPA